MSEMGYQVMVLTTWTPVGQHYKLAMSALSQVGTRHYVTLNVARSKTTTKYIVIYAYMYTHTHIHTYTHIYI